MFITIFLGFYEIKCVNNRNHGELKIKDYESIQE
jgi:hypothetical protein